MTAEIYRVLAAWPVDEFPGDATPSGLKSLNAKCLPGLRYVPEYAEGSETRIELQEYQRDEL